MLFFFYFYFFAHCFFLFFFKSPFDRICFVFLKSAKSLRRSQWGPSEVENIKPIQNLKSSILWQRHLWQRTPKATKTIILKLQAAADVKLGLSSCHMLHICCCLSHPSARGHFCYCLSDADVSFVALWISGIFLLPTLTACETCFATEAIINDHSRHQGLRLAFHYQSLRWALKSTSAFLM